LHRYLQLSQRSTRTALYCRSLYITKTVKLTRYALLVFVRSCSSIDNKIISFKNLFHHSQLGAPQKNPGALGMCPVCPLVKTALCRGAADGGRRLRSHRRNRELKHGYFNNDTVKLFKLALAVSRGSNRASSIVFSKRFQNLSLK